MKKSELKTLSDNTFTSNGVRDITAAEHRNFNNNTIDSMYTYPGSVIAWAGLKTTIPDGWLLCNGASFPKTLYPELFAALGGELSPWGVSSTTFNIPNIPIYGSPVMANQSNENTSGVNRLGLTGGSQTHTLTTDEIPQHTHQYQDSYFIEATPNGFSNEDLGTANKYGNSGMDQDNRYIWYRWKDTRPQGFSGSHNNMQPFAAMYWIIKVY